MRSVANSLREEDRRTVEALTPAERMQLALRLGRESLEIYMAHQGVSQETAIRHFRARNQIGRRPSRCLQGDLG